MPARILLVLSFCLVGILKAQNNLTIVSENGEPFWLYLNEHKLNDSAQVIVTATEVKIDTCTIRVTYTNSKISNITAKVYLLQRGRSCKNLSFMYTIVTEKGKPILKYISTSDIITDSTEVKKSPSEYINSVFISVKKQEDDKNRLEENYPSPTLCAKIINDSLLEKQIASLKDNHIELNRVKDAKWFISNTCLSVVQTQKILTAFDYEDSKLDLAEFAYNYLYDKDNFMRFLKSLKHKTDLSKLEKFYDNKISQ